MKECPRCGGYVVFDEMFVDSMVCVNCGWTNYLPPRPSRLSNVRIDEGANPLDRVPFNVRFTDRQYMALQADKQHGESVPAVVRRVMKLVVGHVDDVQIDWESERVWRGTFNRPVSCYMDADDAVVWRAVATRRGVSLSALVRAVVESSYPE